MKRFLFVLVFISIFVNFSNAQTPVQNFTQHPRAYTHRYSSWFEANIGGSITADKKWQYQIDYQYRRMSDAGYIQGGQHGNIFKDPYQQVFRPWIHYWIKPGAVRFSLSPLGYWATWTPPQEGSIYPSSQGNVGRTFAPEFRTCPQLTIVENIGRLQYSMRYRYEFRWIGSRHASYSGGVPFYSQDFGYGYDFVPNGAYGSNHQGRLRLQARVQFPLNKPKIEKNTWYINAWDELFIGIGRHVGANKMINQNRSVAMLGYRLPTEFPIKIEAGVTYQMNFLYNMNTPPGNPHSTYQKQNVELNTAYTVYLIFDEFHTLFKNKKEKQQEKLSELTK
jgi:hypothetical protein